MRERVCVLLAITCFVFLQIKEMLDKNPLPSFPDNFKLKHICAIMKSRQEILILDSIYLLLDILSLWQCSGVASRPGLLIFPLLPGSSTMMVNRHGWRKLSF